MKGEVVRVKRFVVGVFLALLIVVPTAGAASGSGATTTQYGGQSGIQGTLGESATDPTTSGTLPFTGLDLGVIVLAGIVLVVMGVSLRRFARREGA